MRRLRMLVLSTVLGVGSLFVFAPAAHAGPPEHCYPAGDLPDPCPVAYAFCQTKIGQKVCQD